MQYGQQLRHKIIRNLVNRRSEGDKFALKLDEWTSLGNRRYLNINIHGRSYFLNLGLMRIKGSFSAQLCSDAISKKLNEFGLDFSTDIVAITTDGCAMMRKLGRIIQPFQQLCYAHGLQLVIQDIFYRSKPTSPKLILTTTDSDEDEEVFDEDEEDGGFIVLNTPEQENSTELCYDINDIVTKYVEL